MSPRSLLPALALSLGLALLSSAGEDASADKIRQLIGQLGSQSFAEREKAAKALDAIGAPALEALRKAAKSDDAEVKKRAGELLKKIEKRAEDAKIRAEFLTPKRVHLVYKETPLAEAAADFEKQSGYKIQLLDTKGELKKRKVTVDTGAATFWHALELFCDKTDLVEATYEDWKEWNRAQPAWQGAPGAPGKALPKPKLRKQPQPAPLPGAGGALLAVQVKPAAAAPPVVVRRPNNFAMMLKMAMPGTILLKDGKPQKRSSDGTGAIRVRALLPSDLPWPAEEGKIFLALEVYPEPRLIWEDVESIRIDKALDDRGQSLTQIKPQFPPGYVKSPPMRAGGEVRIIRPAAVFLKKGEKASGALKELQGALSLYVLSEVKPMITADIPAQGPSKTFQGKKGGSIKILDVKTDADNQTTIQFELVQPSTEDVAPGWGIQMKPSSGPLFNESINGLAIQDDKGHPLPIRMGGPQKAGIIRRRGTVATVTYEFICQPRKDQGRPAKVVYLGRQRVAVEVPFRLKDVPLP